MIGLKKKRPFSLKGVLRTDFGLPLPDETDGSPSPPAVSILQSLGIEHVVWTTVPLTITKARSANRTHQDDTSIELVSSYWLDEAFEEFVQQHPLESYRDKYVLLALKEGVSVRALKGPLFEIRARGYEPVILHYNLKSTKLRRTAIQYLCDLGCLFQLDLMALTGQYGTHIKEKAESWLTHGLFSIVTTGIREAEQAELLKILTLSPIIASALKETIERHTRLTYSVTA